MTSAQPDDLLTPTEAAALAGVQPATLKQWVRRGKIKPAKEWGEGNNTRRLFWRNDVLAMTRAAAPASSGGLDGEPEVVEAYRVAPKDKGGRPRRKEGEERWQSD